MKRNASLVTAVLAALALLAGACGSGDDVAATDEDASAAAEPVVPTPEPVATTAPVAVPADDDAPVTDDTADVAVEADDGTETSGASGSAPGETSGASGSAPGEASSDASIDDPADDDSTSAAPVGDTTTTPVPVANDSYLGSYSLTDATYGTQVSVTVADGTRTIVSNALPNHTTGQFPNAANPNAISAQDRSWTLTTSPTVTGQATPVRETGVALNGVKFEPGTAEVVQCASGESYRIEGIQDTFSVGLDTNLAHVQPTGEYHYHGVSPMLVDAFDTDADLVLVGFAADGHLIYYSKSAAFSTSYSMSSVLRTGTDCAYRGQAVAVDGSAPDGIYVSDWVYTAGSGALDECNGTFIDGQYAYLVTEAYPYVPRCLMGEVAAGAGGAGGPGGAGGGQGAPPAGGAPATGAPGGAAGQDAPAQAEPGQAPAGQQGGQQGGQPGQGGPPDLTDAATALGVSVDQLQNLLGGPPPDIDGAASALGMTPDELLAVLEQHGAAPPRR